jgi:hypothetical protein
MEIFISWSGDRSKVIAEALNAWLPKVIQRLDRHCWMSASDIDPGKRWNPEVAEKLAKSTFGIICLTEENLNAPWILFEAGAISKTLDMTLVCPYLHELEPRKLSGGPLSQFQATTTDKAGTFRLIQTINKALAPDALDNEFLKETFSQWWPKLNKSFQKVPSLDDEPDDSAASRIVKPSANSIARMSRE